VACGRISRFDQSPYPKSYSSPICRPAIRRPGHVTLDAISVYHISISKARKPRFNLLTAEPSMRGSQSHRDDGRSRLLARAASHQFHQVLIILIKIQCLLLSEGIPLLRSLACFASLSRSYFCFDFQLCIPLLLVDTSLRFLFNRHHPSSSYLLKHTASSFLILLCVFVRMKDVDDLPNLAYLSHIPYPL